MAEDTIKSFISWFTFIINIRLRRWTRKIESTQNKMNIFNPLITSIKSRS